jgi:hypothetical protein
MKSLVKYLFDIPEYVKNTLQSKPFARFGLGASLDNLTTALCYASENKEVGAFELNLRINNYISRMGPYAAAAQNFALSVAAVGAISVLHRKLWKHLGKESNWGDFFTDAFLDVVGGVGLWNAMFNINNIIRETVSGYFPYVAVAELAAGTAYVMKTIYKYYDKNYRTAGMRQKMTKNKTAISVEGRDTILNF